MTTQMDALAAGADRSENYRAGQRKLQEAMEQFKSGGYPRASDAANQAHDLFAGAAVEARKAKAARPPAVVNRLSHTLAAWESSAGPSGVCS